MSYLHDDEPIDPGRVTSDKLPEGWNPFSGLRRPGAPPLQEYGGFRTEKEMVEWTRPAKVRPWPTLR
jgi:hypothetical protein